METWAPLLGEYGPALVFIAMFIEGEMVVLAAAALSASGVLSIEAVALAAMSGAWLSDQFYFFLGGRLGTAIAERSERAKQALPALLSWAKQRGDILAASLRFLWGLRIAGPAALSTSQYPWPRYAVFSALGAALWASLYSYAGAQLGEHWRQLGYFPLVLLGLLGLGLAINRLLRRRRDKRIGEDRPV